jgi:hypothetical protein
MGYLLRVKTRVLAGASVIPLIVGAISLSPGSVIGAYAAPQSVGHAVFLGTTAPAAGVSGAGFVDSLHDATRPLEVGRPSAPKGPVQVLPSPGGTSVSGSAGGATGFAGLTHRDSRLAGTGVYTNTQFSLEPPDQGLCVGSGVVLETINDVMAVYSAKGTALTAPTALNQFYKRAPAFDRVNGVFGDFLSDPKCYYDPVGGRFVQTILMVDAPGNFDGSSRTHVLVAVSKTGDPTGAWNIFSIDTSNDGNNGTPNHVGCPCLPDQPLLGANRDAIFISTNEFQLQPPANFGLFNGAQIYALSRSELEEGSGSSTPAFVHIDVGQVATGDANLPFWGSIQPSTSPRPGSGTELLMSGGPEDILQNNAVVDNRIAVWSLAGTDTLNSEEPSLQLSHQVLTSEAYGSDVAHGFGATQKSGPTPLRDALSAILGVDLPLSQLNANDSRMNQVTLANGKLFGTVNTVVTAAGQPDRVGIAYFVVDAQAAENNGDHGGNRQARGEEGGGGARIANQGYLAVDGKNVLFGSIGVNSQGTGAMVFTLSGPDFFPSAAYVRFDAHGAHGAIHVTGLGQLPEDGFTGYPPFGSIARWGDYSAAVAARDGSIWMATEWIPGTARTVNANWGTFISHLGGGED